MNYAKIQSKLLEAWDKNEPRASYGKWDDERTAFTLDGSYLVIVPNERFYLDQTNASFPPTHVFENKSIHPEHYDDKKQWCTTGIKQKIIKKKMTLVELTDTNYYKYINEKNLKVFEDRYNFITLQSTADFASPVYVYQNEELIGLIMPVKMQEVENNERH